MKRTILSLLVAGLFAGAGTSAMAQVNTTGAADQPAEKTQGMTPESDSTTQKPAQSAASEAAPGHPALEGARGSTTSKPEDTAASKPTHPALEGADRSTSKPDKTSAQDEAKTQNEDAKTKCNSLQGDAKSICIAQTRIAPDTIAEGDSQSDTVSEATAAAGAKSANDDVAQTPGSQKYVR